MPLGAASPPSMSAERVLPESGSPSAEDSDVSDGVWLERDRWLPSLSWLLERMLLPRPFFELARCRPAGSPGMARSAGVAAASETGAGGCDGGGGGGGGGGICAPAVGGAASSGGAGGAAPAKSGEASEPSASRNGWNSRLCNWFSLREMTLRGPACSSLNGLAGVGSVSLLLLCCLKSSPVPGWLKRARTQAHDSQLDTYPGRSSGTEHWTQTGERDRCVGGWRLDDSDSGVRLRLANSLWSLLALRSSRSFPGLGTGGPCSAGSGRSSPVSVGVTG